MDYPWYQCVADDSIEQGDIFESCPVFIPPDNLTLDINAPSNATFRWEKRDVIVMSQTCDLVKGRKKLSEILLCSVWNRSELTGHLATSKGMEDARRGNLPAYHVLAACSLQGQAREIRIADFRQVYSLPVSFLRQLTTKYENHIRLLPPYREHLSQAFARFFMRVGLPVDIPQFK